MVLYNLFDDSKTKIIGGAVGAVFAVIAAVAVGVIVVKLEVCSRGKEDPGVSDDAAVA